MLIIKILLCLALYPSWSSTITVEEKAKLNDELEKTQEELASVHLLDDGVEEWNSKLNKMMKAATVYGKVIFDEMQEKSDENEIEENGTSSFTPGIVDEALKALKTASTGSTDVLKDLNELGPKLAHLMKAAVPIGGLISKKLNPKPESDEYKALMDFKNQSAEIWNNISAITRKPIGSLGGQKVSIETEVYIPISVLKDLTNTILNPEIKKREGFLIGYTSNCKNDKNDPTPILKVSQLLKSLLVTKCGDSLTTEDVKQITEHRAILMRAFRQFQVKNKTLPEPSIHLSEFMNIYKHVDKSFSIENMKVFKKDFYSYERAIDAFFKELREQSTARNFEDECLLRALTISTTFNYTRIGLFARRLHNELIDLAFSSAICASSMGPDPSSIDKYTEEVSDMVNLITTFSSKWLNESLTAAWPLIHNQILQEQIRKVVKQPGHFDREILRNAAKLTIAVLSHTGIPNYTYDMLFVKAPEKNFQFHFESLSNNYYFDKGDFGFNTVLVRRPFNYSNHMDQLNLQDKMRRLTDYAENLKTSITYEMKDLYDAKNITEVAEGLKNKLGSFVSKNGFQGFAIARKWEKTIFESCSAIDDVQYSKNSFTTIYNFSYQNSGNFLQHCQTFNFYFFL